MEEAAFISPMVFYKVIAPLMGVTGTSTIGISTPGGGDNYYSILMNQRVNGRLLFHVLSVGLACDACRAEGKTLECTHNKMNRPSWKSEQAQKLLRDIMPPELFMMETLGINPEATNKAFSSDQVARLFRAPRIDVEPTKGIVWIMVDPSSSGDLAKKSRTAMVAFVATQMPSTAVYGIHIPIERYTVRCWLAPLLLLPLLPLPLLLLPPRCATGVDLNGGAVVSAVSVNRLRPMSPSASSEPVHEGRAPAMYNTRMSFANAA